MKKIAFLMLFALLLLTGFNLSQNTSNQLMSDGDENPLLTEWNTPFGVPPFDLIANDHYLPAFRISMEEHKAEVDAIINNTEAATFENTIEALEESGRTLSRVSNVFYAINSANTNDKIDEIAQEIAPELSAHNDDIYLNADLFERVKTVYDEQEKYELSAEQLRLLNETYKGFIRSGVGVPAEKQDRLREINSRLAELSQTFGKNLLAETNNFETYTDNEADIADLPTSLVAAAAAEAVRRGHESGWSFTLQRPSINPFLQYSGNREMRRKLFMGYALRGDNGNENDNNAVLSEMASLRVERANMMGYESHAAFILSDNMAENPGNVYSLMEKVWVPALEVAKQERADMQALMNASGVEGAIQGWDWRYYTEKVRQEKFAFDAEALRPYFEVSAVRDGAFEVANKLFGLTFHPLEDMPKWHPTQEVFEVKEADGTHLGVLYMDYFARESKRGGAWMNDLQAQSTHFGTSPIVTNNFNFPQPAEGQPALLNYSEANTLFHEFGHALHGLLSNVEYSSLSGTNTPRDFVEFPSQVMENWMGEPEVLRMFAKHYETGEVIPDELIEKLKASGTFNQGFATVEFMAAAYLDMNWHTLTTTEMQDAKQFEIDAMNEIGLINEIIPRYRSTYFAHIFSGGYSSGYYSYLWSEVLDADAFAAFKETNLFDQTLAGKYREMLSKGGSRPGMELYEAFRGRAPEIAPLLSRRGLDG